MDQFSRAAANRLPTWVKRLAAPLLMLSLGLHGLLLVVPIPPPPEPPAPDPEPPEEFVDLISISELIPPAPVAPAVVPPPPLPAPNQPVLPPSNPVTPQADGEPPAAATTPEQGLAATPPPEEVNQLFTQLTRGSGDSDFDATETLFPFAAYSTRQGIQEWSGQEQACFFSQISADTYSLRPPALSLRYLTRNVQFIETQDIPRTFPAPQFEVSQLEGGYCQRSLFQVLKGGQPLLFISVVGIGVGTPGQQGNGLVIIWSGDPRTG